MPKQHVALSAEERAWQLLPGSADSLSLAKRRAELERRKPGSGPLERLDKFWLRPDLAWRHVDVRGLVLPTYQREVRRGTPGALEGAREWVSDLLNHADDVVREPWLPFAFVSGGDDFPLPGDLPPPVNLKRWWHPFTRSATPDLLKAQLRLLLERDERLWPWAVRSFRAARCWHTRATRVQADFDAHAAASAARLDVAQERAHKAEAQLREARLANEMLVKGLKLALVALRSPTGAKGKERVAIAIEAIETNPILQRLGVV